MKYKIIPVKKNRYVKIQMKFYSRIYIPIKPVLRNRLNYTTLNHIIIITIQNRLRKTTAIGLSHVVT